MRSTRKITVGGVAIGGGERVSVQSMTNTDTSDIDSTVSQIEALTEAGCEIVRVAVPDMRAANCLGEIKKRTKIPLIADIHFDYRLAIKAIEEGADGLRLNPGNIGARYRVEEVVKAASEKNIPIRIGVNAGSLTPELLSKYGGPTAEAMVESGLDHIRILEELDYREIKVSLKASNVPVTVEAYHLLAEKVDYPFHIGISEAGAGVAGTVKSAVGIGVLLYSGLGDTMRVSLTGDPVQEIKVAFEILKSLRLRDAGPEIVSCPTCGRCKIDLVNIAADVEEALGGMKDKITVAIMGCVVNGPGEAREADVGLAGGDGVGLIFRKGVTVKRVREDEMRDALMEEVKKFVEEIKSA